jgi:hypothetical protein
MDGKSCDARPAKRPSGNPADRQIPLFGSVAEFPPDPNKINRLQGRVWLEKGLNQRIFVVFPRKTGDPLVVC